jgi:transposase
MILTRVALRELAPEERQTLEHLASSRTAQARFVERAQILLALAAGRRPRQVAKDLGISRPAVSFWIHRFNQQGLAGLEDQPRAGRPPTYTAKQRAEVIATALTAPKSLDLPFACWTLDRLQAYLNEQKGIPIKRSRIDEILRAEGLRWRHQETWFGERVDPDFAEKRGASSGSTPSRRRALSSSASTRWVRSRPRASRASNSSPPRPSRRSSRPSQDRISPSQAPSRKSRPRSHSRIL